jgi:tetratricopeptide (TPR) repeat protein
VAPSPPPTPVLPGAPEPAPPPPADLPPGLAATWREIASFADAIDEMNYFQMLEVEENPTPDQVRDAYFAKVKKLHPDRLPRELHALKPWADRAFHHLTEARDQLSEDDTRLAHLKAVRSGGGTPASDRKLGAIVGAAMEYQKVEVLVRRKEWDEALRILDLNIALSPDEADYHAMKGFVLFQQHGAEGPHAATMIAALDRALSIYPKHGRANFTKASVLKVQGKMSQAIDYFRKVLEVSPKHLEAGREVRLYEMRQGRSSGHSPSAKGGESLLDKLKGLGRKK